MSYTNHEMKHAALALAVTLQRRIASMDNPDEIEAAAHQFAATVAGLVELLYIPAPKESQ